MNQSAIPYLLNPIEEHRHEDRRIGPAAAADGPLAELRHVRDYTIADNHPEIRGWDVKTAASFGERTVGTVEDLIVDAATLRVRYLLVCLNRDAIATTRDRRILVPVGVARVDGREDEVRVDGYTSGELVGVPEFRPGKLTRRYEMLIRRRFSPSRPRAGPQSRRTTDFYANEEFDERSFWADRRRGRDHVPYLTRHAHTA